MLRIVISFVVAFAAAALGGKGLIPLLRRMKAGQSIKEIGPTWHQGKNGTPTMGGLTFYLGVLVGVVLGYTLSSGFFLLSGFVGAGLILAGMTGFCGMARLLDIMPWNRRTH